ncbi:MAG: response regulator [Desulfuromonadales bacterium]|nr:response regulator [Desulfuromonadales bacterium]
MKKKLLLADDSITIQKVVEIIFAKEGFELLIASDGDKAFDLVLTHKPDVVIADIMMPGKNGFELCQAIKSHPALGTTSVLLLPGAFEEFDETKALDVCADGWLTKPFESQALIDKVTALFEVPPLRLVSAAQVEAEHEVSAETVTAEQMAPAVADLTPEAGEEDFWGVPELDNEPADAANDTSVAVSSSDSELWSEVSFEENDLKPQELLAASDEDQEESAEPAADDPYPSAQALTPEQLAPYVSAPASSAPPREDQQGFEDQGVTAETDFADAAHMAEPGPSFEFVATDGREEDHSTATVDESDDVPELMAEDLEQEQALVEDSATFIDLTAADEEMADETSAAADVSMMQEEEPLGADDIFDLTEGDVVEEEEIMIAASEEVASFEAPATGRDDDLFSDDVEKVTTAAAAAEFADSAAEDELEAEIDAEEQLIAAEPEEIEELEAVEAEADSFEEFAIVPPLVAPAAETLEEQLRQLPEEEIAQIVEKVAGPLIERLAREMLEQVVWEVVPDLAETMISAEIEKIKRGEV